MVSFTKLKSPKEEAEKAPHEPRRITIPASQRLSTILGKNEDDKSRARDAQRQSLKQAGAVAGIPGEDSSENSVDTSNHDSGYSFQVYSGHPNEKKPPKGRHGSRTYREEAKRRKRRRNLCILGVVLFVVVILAIAIGVPLSLKSKKSKTDSYVSGLPQPQFWKLDADFEQESDHCPPGLQYHHLTTTRNLYEK